MRVVSALLVLLAGVACSARAPVWVSSEDAVSVVTVIFDSSSAIPRVRAFDVARDAAPRRVEIDADVEGTLYVAKLDTPLDTHGLEEGPQQVAEVGFSVERATEVLRADLSADAIRLEPVDPIPTELAQLRIAPSLGSPCTRFGLDVISVPGSEGVRATFIVSIGEARALVGTSGGALFIVQDGAVTPASLPLDLPIDDAFYHAASDEVWLFGTDGAVARGHPDRGFVEAPPRPSRAILVRVDGSRGDAPFELFAMTSSRAFERFDGSSWTSLGGVTPRGEEGRERVGVAWAGPSRAVAIGFGGEGTAVYDRGRVEAIDLVLPQIPATAADAAYSAEYVAGFGAMIGTRYARLFQLLEEGGYTLYERPPGNPRIQVTIGLKSGLLFGGQDGVLIQYYPEHGYCDSEAYAFEPDDIAPLGDGFAAIKYGGLVKPIDVALFSLP